MSALHHAGGPGGSPVAAHFTSVSATNPVTRVAATVRYSPRPWGTVLDTRVENVPAGARCQLVVTDSSRHSTVVGGWTTSYDESSVWYPAHPRSPRTASAASRSPRRARSWWK